MNAVYKTLDQMFPCEEGVFVGVDGGMGAMRRLHAMGLHEGQELQVLCRQPARGPVVVQIGGRMTIAIGRGLARRLRVRVQPHTESGRVRS